MSQTLYDLNSSAYCEKVLKATAVRVKGDLVRVKASSAGFVDASLADDTDKYCVAVATQDCAVDDFTPYVVSGPVTITVPSGNYTAGHGLLILNGAIASSGATADQPFSGEDANDFAVILEGGTAVTEVKALLYGSTFTATT